MGEVPEKEIRCKAICPKEVWPYAYRCKSEKAKGQEMCQDHIDEGYEL